MKREQKQIEEAAKAYSKAQTSLYPMQEVRSMMTDNEVKDWLLEAFITGAKSQAAKEFHTSGMYRECEVETLCGKAIRDSSRSMSDFLQGKTMDLVLIPKWFAENKKNNVSDSD